MKKPIWEWDILKHSVTTVLIVLILSVSLGGVAIVTGTLFEVDDDEYGVVVDQSSNVHRVVDSGWHVRNPVTEHVIWAPKNMRVRDETSTFAGDGREFTVEYTANMSFNHKNASTVYKRGSVYAVKETYIKPCTQASLRNTTNKYDTKTLIDNRDLLNQSEFVCDSGSFDVRVKNIK